MKLNRTKVYDLNGVDIKVIMGKSGPTARISYSGVLMLKKPYRMNMVFLNPHDDKERQTFSMIPEGEGFSATIPTGKLKYNHFFFTDENENIDDCLGEFYKVPLIMNKEVLIGMNAFDILLDDFFNEWGVREKGHM